MKQENLLAMYRGKLAEQFVAQEILAKNSSEFFYWARDVRGSSAEVDYLAVRQGNIYPVEVKSGAGGSLKSLHLMLENTKIAHKDWCFTAVHTKNHLDRKSDLCYYIVPLLSTIKTDAMTKKQGLLCVMSGTALSITNGFMTFLLETNNE